MPSLIGPSHHIFYAYLHRRRLWLSHLVRAFEPYAGREWSEAKKRLDVSYARALVRLSADIHYGIRSSLPLGKVLDDTPVDSFLTVLSQELDAYEQNLFDLITRSSTHPDWLPELEQVSMLWGRELAQEVIIAMNEAKAPSGALPVGRSVRGFFEIFSSVLQGGDFAWKPLLLRRCTDAELEYEHRQCPHRKPIASQMGADCACRLEGLMYAGFAQAFNERVCVQRHQKNNYCVDQLRLTSSQ